MAEIEDIKAIFDKAVALVASGSFNASDDDKLKLYGFFKQATVGKCNTSRPGFFDFVGKAKWFAAATPISFRDAWNKLGDMSSIDAIKGYIDVVDALAPGWSEGVQQQVSSSQKSKSAAGFGPVFSMMSNESGPKDGPMTLHDFASEGDFAAVDRIIQTGGNIDLKDEEGRTALLLAADRNHIEIVRLLLKNKANPNAADSQGQTALHNAVVCENIEVIQALLEAGADPNVKDSNGESAKDICSSEQIMSLLTRHEV